MMAIKSGGKVIGGKLTNAEKKALDIETRKVLAEYNEKNMTEIDAIMLWWLRRRLGFGEKRLREFYFDFRQEVNALTERYECEKIETPWVMTKKLLDEGIDLVAWERELDAMK